VLAAGQQVGAAVLLAAPVTVAGTAHPPTAEALAAVAALGLVCTGLAFVLWFRLLARVGPVAAVTVTLLAPVFGVLWGAAFLGEPVTPGLVGGMAAVLVGVYLIVGKPATPKPAAPEHPEPARRPRGDLSRSGPPGALHGAGEGGHERVHIGAGRGVAERETQR
jgi:drug/metabolite transporter (DMT)-like permease